MRLNIFGAKDVFYSSTEDFKGYVVSKEPDYFSIFNLIFKNQPEQAMGKDFRAYFQFPLNKTVLAFYLLIFLKTILSCEKRTR
jgi:hypothetical protein